MSTFHSSFSDLIISQDDQQTVDSSEIQTKMKICEHSSRVYQDSCADEVYELLQPQS